MNYQSRKELNMNISIIITFYNNKNILHTCLSTLNETLKYTNEKIEVIIVNDNPQVDLSSTLDMYKGVLDLNLVSMQKNSGYSAACNEGVKIAKYNFILLMDCDIIPCDNWLNSMIQTMNDIDDNGCVSATIVDMLTNRIYGYGFGVYGVDTIHFFQNRELDCCPKEDMDFPILSSGCMLMPKKLYLDVGGQDIAYLNAFNDFDFTYNCFKKNHPNRMSRNAIVFHRGHVAGNARTNFYADSKAYFFRKFGSELDSMSKKMLLEIYQKYSTLNNTSIIVVNFSNSLYRNTYVNMFTDIHKLEILQNYDFKNIGMNKIIINDYLTLDMCRLDIPILYFVDEYAVLEDNYFWFVNRKGKKDIIIDRHANILDTDSFSF